MRLRRAGRLAACLTALVGLAVGSAAAGLQPARPGRPPNIILILADDLGFGDLGCYGQATIRTPTLDRMAREGVRFTQFYAGSTVCAPSRCVLMTGLHTGHCIIRGNRNDDLPSGTLTLARVLHRAGYRTGLIGKWGLASEGGPGIPTRQGFDSFFGYLGQAHAHNYYPSYLFRDDRRVPLRNVVPAEGPFGQGRATTRLDYSHDLFAEEALRFVDENRERSFFLYLAFTIPHANNEAGKKGMEVPDLGEYADSPWPEPERSHAAMITRMDRDIGRLMTRLKVLGLDHNTLVLFTSDNGPHQEGGHDAQFHRSSGRLRGIKRDLYEGGIRVPLIARWPAMIPPAAESDFVGYFPDLLPTLAHCAGAPPQTGLDGIDFYSSLVRQGAGHPTHDYLYWEFHEGETANAIRMRDWKGICKPFGGRMELYDLARDPGETRDLAADRSDIVVQLRHRLRQAHIPNPRWKLPQERDAEARVR